MTDSGDEDPPTCLTIAGSDSSGGAGIQADLKTFAALGCYGTSAITAITAQNSLGVRAVQGVDPEILRSQLNALFDDVSPRAIKTGMLYSKTIIQVVADELHKDDRHVRFPIVIDPVMVSTSGHTLLTDDAIETLCTKLVPLATIITPNVPEAEVLAGLPTNSIRSQIDMEDAARKIAKLGPRYVLLKGGHLPLPGNGAEGPQILDILYDSQYDACHVLRNPQLVSRNTHGTGCTLSAAICASLASYKSMRDSVEQATCYVRTGIKASYSKGAGAGPVNHMHSLVRRTLMAPSLSSPYPFTDYLISRTGKLWQRYVEHPFTTQLGRGTLPLSAFLYFIRQDYSFLLHYARTNALAAYKAKTFEELQASTFIVQTVLHEVEMHVKYCAEHGITKQELEQTKESITNIAYNRYVLDVSNTGSMLDLRVATAPCLLGYGEVGVRLVDPKNTQVDHSKNNIYYEWALNYAKDDFQSAVTAGRNLLEQSVANEPLSQSRLDELSQIFTQTTELEIAFWDAALVASQSNGA